MTPRHKFPATVRSDNALDPEALVDFVEAVGFIYATKRTRAHLLALVADKVLKVKDNRFTMRGRAE